MSAEFDASLAAALAPPVREPDQDFAARIDRLIEIEQRLAGQRRAMLTRLGTETAGIAAVGAGLWAVARSPAVAEAAAEAPHVALMILIGTFGLWLAVGGVLRAPRPGFATSL